MEETSDTRTYGERIAAIRQQAETEGLVDTEEVRAVLDSMRHFSGLRSWALDGDQGLRMSQQDGTNDDIAYLKSLLPSDPSQGQLSV